MTDELDRPAGVLPPADVTGFSDTELRALLARAREGGDEPLRRLVSSYITLRTLAAEMVSMIEVREGSITVVRTPLFARLKALTARRTV